MRAAIELTASAPAWPATLTLEDCELTDNISSEPGVGGAVVADAGAPVTLTSIDTDWGEGEHDNGPADVAFYQWDDENNVPATPQHYSWDGVASFTCDGLTSTCTDE